MSVTHTVDPTAISTPREPTAHRASLRLPATLLLAGHLLYLVVTLLHPGGEANDHHHVFARYADSGHWVVVHLGQFAGMTLLLGGLIVLASTLDGSARVTARLGAGAATATLALYGALQAVDGIALKQAVTAWAGAPDAERAGRFASAEAIRWLEWGMRSYQNLSLGVALVLLAAAAARASRIPRPIAALMALTGLTHLVQGWVLGSDGFSHTGSLAIVAASALDLAWMIGLVVTAWREPAPDAASRW